MSVYKTLKKINKVAFPDDAPNVINCGDCHLWAAIAKRLIPDAELLSAEDWHAFVKIGDKYYDAERLHGVKHWWSLPANKELDSYDHELEPVKHGTIAFYKFWCTNRNLVNKLVARIRRCDE